MKHYLHFSLLGLALSCISSRAQTYQINWFTLDGGGGTSTDGAYAVGGSIGQPDAGAMSGGAFTMNGGFWAGVGREPRPALSIRLGGANTVVLSWANPSTGFLLEEAPTPLGPAWTTVSQVPVVVAGEKRVTLTPTGSGRMFRLRRP